MFPNFLDDLELQREEEWKLIAPTKSTPHPGPLPGRGGEGKVFKPAIEAPYRWRDWAAKSDGITGDELLAFINNEEATLPNGKKDAGLFAYLRKLTSSDTASAASAARDTVATVFKGVDNRMKSGYLLRDVVNKIAGSRDSTPHPRPLPGRGGEGANPATNCTRWARSTNPCSARCAMLRAIGPCSTNATRPPKRATPEPAAGQD